MRFFTVRRLALVAFLPALSALAVVPGCSNQGEGERCGTETVPNDDDCNSGLTCQPVLDANRKPNYRCCAVNSSNSLCRDATPADTSDAGVSGSGGGAGTAGASGGSAGAPTAGGSSGATETEAGSAGAAEAGAAGSN